MPSKNKVYMWITNFNKVQRQRYLPSRVTSFHDLTSDQEMDRSDIRRSLGSNLLRRFAEHIFSLENQIYVLFYRWCIDHSNSCKHAWIMHFRQNRISWSSNKIYFMYRYLISIDRKVYLYSYYIHIRESKEKKI